jgi:hypothetical protein
MNPPRTNCLLLETPRLLPDAWLPAPDAGPVRAFNPALLRAEDGWLLAYRVVLPDGARRIGLCRLDRTLAVVAGSTLPITDRVRFRRGHDYPEVALRWFADPRLYRFGARIYLYWNSGWHEPRNHQFLQELDPRSLLPVGTARELQLAGTRRKLEKNWTFFAAPETGKVHAIYSILPHRVLSDDLSGEGDIRCETTSELNWSLDDYPASHGGLRGGAPPCLWRGEYWVFCHSVHDAPEGYRYAAAAYRFSANAPHHPTARPRRELPIRAAGGEARAYHKLNPAVGEVIYPCGAAHDGDRWMISHGINDEQCAITSLTDEEVEATLEPWSPTGTSGPADNFPSPG